MPIGTTGHQEFPCPAEPFEAKGVTGRVPGSVHFESPEAGLNHPRQQGLHPIFWRMSPNRYPAGIQDHLDSFLWGEEGGWEERRMAITDIPIEGFVHGVYMTGTHHRPGQVRPAESGPIGSGLRSDGLDGHLDALIPKELYHTPHSLFPEADRPLFMAEDQIRFRVYEISEDVQLSLIQGAANLKGRYYLNGPSKAKAVQASDPGHGVMVRQGDDIQSGFLTKS